MKNRLKRWLALMMCAVMMAGMAPETIIAAEEATEEVREEAGLFPESIDLEPGDWLPDQIEAGKQLLSPNESSNPTGVDGLYWRLENIYEDEDYTTCLRLLELIDIDGEGYNCHEAFAKNRTYYLDFYVYSFGEPEDGAIPMFDYTGNVRIRGNTLKKVEGMEGHFFLEMATGTVVRHKLTVSMGDHGTLPESVKDGIMFEEGADISIALGAKFSDITAAVNAVNGYYVTGWSDGKTTVTELKGYDITKAVADVTLTAQWAPISVVTGADFRFNLPYYGMSENDINSKGLFKRSETQLSCRCYGIYTDKDLETPVDDDHQLEEGKVYYARIQVDPVKGWVIDKDSLPDVTVNGERVELYYCVVENDATQEQYEFWCFDWSFTPEEKKTQYYDLVLNYNYPGEPEYKHRISGIPEGTDIDAEGDFSLLKALRYKVTEGAGITYDEYLALLEEHKDDENFPANQEYVSLRQVNGHYCREQIKTSPSFDDYESYRDDTFNTEIDKDLNLYYFWAQELKSAEIESIVAPVCGQKQEDYNGGLGPGTGGITYETGIRGYTWKFVLSDNKAGRLDEDTVFEGDKEYYILLDGFTFDEGEAGYRFFDKYMTMDVKLSYNGTEYAQDENYDYLIPVKAVHDMSAEAATEKENEVAAKCETAGSYDEVLKYECTYCHKTIETVTHKTVDALDHDWGEWTVSKEATETEDGEEVRVCKRDPDHKESRVIPKKEKQEEQKDDDNKDDDKKEDDRKDDDKKDDDKKDDDKKEEIIPDIQKPITVSENIMLKFNEADITIEADVTYPKAVSWTGNKITKEQLAALSKDGVIARVKISGLEKAIEGMNREADTGKLFNLSYVIDKEKKVNSKGSFYVKLKLNNKEVKKAKIKGKDKKALGNIVKDLNRQFKDNPYSFDIVPIELKDAESVTIKAKLKKDELQLNDDGSIKGFKSLKIKVRIPGKKAAKTYSFSAKKALKCFTITVSDKQNKKAEVTALAGQNFAGTRSGADITK